MPELLIRLFPWNIIICSKGTFNIHWCLFKWRTLSIGIHLLKNLDFSHRASELLPCRLLHCIVPRPWVLVPGSNSFTQKHGSKIRVTILELQLESYPSSSDCVTMIIESQLVPYDSYPSRSDSVTMSMESSSKATTYCFDGKNGDFLTLLLMQPELLVFFTFCR